MFLDVSIRIRISLDACEYHEMSCILVIEFLESLRSTIQYMMHFSQDLPPPLDRPRLRYHRRFEEEFYDLEHYWD